MEIKSSLQLIIKILIIIGLPLLILFYVDNKGKIVESDESDNKSTREIAIINEDNGVEVEDELIFLGEEVSTVLNDNQGQNYKWTVVGRSTAEQGLRDRLYDAVIYIPSDFSANAMTFQEENPVKSELKYTFQPFLDAKERQRIHREMAEASHLINDSISSMYWSYVSQEIKGIRNHFDNILEKEVSFQDVIHSFYTDTSKELTEDVSDHRNNLQQLLGDTTSLGQTTEDYVSSNDHAVEEIEQFAAALEDYKETQQEQQQLLDEYLLNNQEAIDQGLDANDQIISDGLHEAENEMDEHITRYFQFRNSLHHTRDDFDKTLAKGEEKINEWSEESEDLFNKKDELFTGLLEAFSDEYLKLSFEKNNEESLEQLRESIDEILEADIPLERIEFERPGDREELDFEEMRNILKALGDEIEQVKRVLEPSDEDEASEYELIWEPLKNEYEASLNQLETLKSTFEEDNTVEEWKEYATTLENLITFLDESKEATIQKVMQHIDHLQESIVHFYEGFDDDVKEELKEKFEQVDNILSDRNLNDVLTFENHLIKHLTVLEQKLVVDKDLIIDIFEENDEVKEHENQIMNWYNINQSFKIDLKKLLGLSDEEVKEAEEDIKNLLMLMEEVEIELENYIEFIRAHREETNELLAKITEETDNVLAQLRDENSETFEWKESPSLAQLDENIPVDRQEDAKNSLEQLADLISSLEDNQEMMFDSTETLQNKVANVQNEANDLNNRWDQNVETTGLIKDDVYNVLSNTIVDGQYNPYVYNFLSAPVDIQDQTTRVTVPTKSAEYVPPVIMLLVMLISSLLIGFITNHYSNVSFLIQGSLFSLLNLAVAVIISLYSAKIYMLSDAQSIKWFILTALVLFAASNIIRGGLHMHTFIGWLASIGLIIFFVIPLIDISLSEFTFNHPIATVYLGLQYEINVPYTITVIALAVITLLISAGFYFSQKSKYEKEGAAKDEEVAS